jgi:hypothetical protein
VIRVLVLGQPFFASRIAGALDSVGGDMQATFIAQGSYLGLLARPPRTERVVLMRAGYRVGATTPRGRLFDAYWSILRRALPDAVPCHYWLGSDVEDTLVEAGAGTLRSSALAATRDDLHLATAPWLASELEAVNLHAITVHVPQPYHSPEEPPPLPTEFRVLTYLPTRRFELYGGDTILEVARRLPHVRFDVVASRGENVQSAPANVYWHGWVADMTARYAQATVVVRIPRHDGLGATVIEGLLNARHVIYTHDLPFVRTIWPATADALVDALGDLEDAHRAGELAPNLAGRSYATDVYDETREANNLAALLRERA